MARTKRCRVSRFRGITNRHPGILHHGRSIIDLTSSSQIQKILNSDLNDNLSNQFILREQETPDKPNAANAKQRKGAHSKNNKINFGVNNSEKEELKTKKRRTKRKKEQPQNQEQIEAETEELNAYFGEVNDFELQYETMPREKRQYVDKALEAYTTLEEVNSATSFWLDEEAGSNAKTPNCFATSTSSCILRHQPPPRPPPVANSAIHHPMDEFKAQRQQTIMAYPPIITQPTVPSPPHRVLGASLASGVRQRSHPPTGHHSQVTHSRGKPPPPPTPPTVIQPHKEKSPPPPLQSKPSLPDGSLPSSSVDIKTFSSDANSRSNLLQQIQQGTKLKKVGPPSSDRTPVPTNPPSLRDNVMDQIRQGITFNHVDQKAEAENIWHSAGDSIHVQEIGGLAGALKERHTNTNSEGLKNFLELCEQNVVLTWEEFQSPSCSFEKCSKIGEGAFGEVFKALVQNVYVALKIIPFALNAKQCSKIVNGDSLKPAKQIFNEVYITKELTKLSDETGFANFATPSFVQLIMSKIVKGPYPHKLLKAWDAFKKAKPNMTENERPDTYADDTQHFLIIALSYGGQDMESYKIRRGNECYSIFYQLALSIAVAEEAIEFEHRDLHLGNVLIDNCPVNETICYTFHGQRIQLISNGVKVSIIDFSLSRMHKKSVDLEVYMDLSKDTALFRQEGVKDGGDFQYDVYRLMREATENVWKNFVPKTNVFWLSYAAKKLFSSHFIRAKRKKELNKLFSNFEENEKISDFLFSDHFLSVFKEFTLE